MDAMYSNVVKTRILDPRTFNQNRCEFRLDESNSKVFLSNLRLINLGATSTNSTDNYNVIGLGHANCIQSIHLYSGNQLLDQLRDVPSWLAFRNTNNTTKLNAGKVPLDGASVAYLSQGQTDWATVGEKPSVTENSIGYYPFGVNFKTTLTSGVNDVADNTGWVSVKDMLPFLKSAMSLPTKVLTNLRLVIQFNTLAQINKLRAFNDDTDMKIIEPSLVVDEVMEGAEAEALEKGFQGVSYDAIEADKLIVPAISNSVDNTEANGGVKATSNTYLVNSFSNKYVKKLILATQPTDPSTYSDGLFQADSNGIIYGGVPSMSQWDPTVQVRINGQNKIYGNGFEGWNRRLGQLVDTCGEMVVPLSMNVPGYTNFDTTNEDSGFRGMADWTGVPVEDYVNECKITLGRSAILNNADINQRLQLLVFGIVQKTLRVNPDGSFNIFY